MKIDWTELALDRVDEIAQHIAADDREAAIRWTVGLFKAVDRLAKFPESGRIVPELAARRTRELIYGAYRVFYRVGSTVQVLSVRRGSQVVRRGELEED
jgi:plasmid stabilization system protein ParE